MILQYEIDIPEGKYKKWGIYVLDMQESKKVSGNQDSIYKYAVSIKTDENGKLETVIEHSDEKVFTTSTEARYFINDENIDYILSNKK